MDVTILIVEDDEQKRDKLYNFLHENFPSIQVHLAVSYQSGLAQLKQSQFNFIVLDMSLPTFDKTVDEDGGRHLAFGGKEILRQMTRRKMRIPVVVVTQFDSFGEGEAIITREELNKELNNSFPEIYQGMVFYSGAADSWKDQLASFTHNILESNANA